jgi:hypothetical protein
MKTSISKNNIILVLLIAVILLLAVNIVLEKYYHPFPSSKKIDLPASIINEKFLLSLDNYNMDPTWISRKNISGIHGDSLNFNYAVEVPPDLPVSLLLREIQNQFDTSEVNILSTEFKSDNSTELNISSGDKLKLIAKFSYNRSISRNTDTIGFVLTGIEDLNSNNLKNLLLIPEHFAAALTPSKHSEELLKILKDNQKEGAVILNDDISELEFKLKTGYSERRNKSSILSIIGKFHNAAFFIIDEKSDIYNSNHYKMIRTEFSKRKILLVSMDKFSDQENSSPGDFIKAVKSNKNSGKLYRVTADGFLEMPPYLAALRKTGYKFIDPSVLINR